MRIGRRTRASDDTAEVDANMILNMLRARDDARAARDFETADDIRSVLREDWGVSLVDDMREWWVGGDRGGGTSSVERAGSLLLGHGPRMTRPISTKSASWR